MKKNKYAHKTKGESRPELTSPPLKSTKKDGGKDFEKSTNRKPEVTPADFSKTPHRSSINNDKVESTLQSLKPTTNDLLEVESTNTKTSGEYKKKRDGKPKASEVYGYSNSNHVPSSSKQTSGSVKKKRYHKDRNFNRAIQGSGGDYYSPKNQQRNNHKRDKKNKRPIEPAFLNSGTATSIAITNPSLQNNSTGEAQENDSASSDRPSSSLMEYFPLALEKNLQLYSSLDIDDENKNNEPSSTLSTSNANSSSFNETSTSSGNLQNLKIPLNFKHGDKDYLKPTLVSLSEATSIFKDFRKVVLNLNHHDYQEDVESILESVDEDMFFQEEINEEFQDEETTFVCQEGNNEGTLEPYLDEKEIKEAEFIMRVGNDLINDNLAYNEGNFHKKSVLSLKSLNEPFNNFDDKAAALNISVVKSAGLFSHHSAVTTPALSSNINVTNSEPNSAAPVNSVMSKVLGKPAHSKVSGVPSNCFCLDFEGESNEMETNGNKDKDAFIKSYFSGYNDKAFQDGDEKPTLISGSILSSLLAPPIPVIKLASTSATVLMMSTSQVRMSNTMIQKRNSFQRKSLISTGSSSGSSTSTSNTIETSQKTLNNVEDTSNKTLLQLSKKLLPTKGDFNFEPSQQNTEARVNGPGNKFPNGLCIFIDQVKREYQCMLGESSGVQESEENSIVSSSRSSSILESVDGEELNQAIETISPIELADGLEKVVLEKETQECSESNLNQITKRRLNNNEDPVKRQGRYYSIDDVIPKFEEYRILDEEIKDTIIECYSSEVDEKDDDEKQDNNISIVIEVESNGDYDNVKSTGQSDANGDEWEKDNYGDEVFSLKVEEYINSLAAEGFSGESTDDGVKNKTHLDTGNDEDLCNIEKAGFCNIGETLLAFVDEFNAKDENRNKDSSSSTHGQVNDNNSSYDGGTVTTRIKDSDISHERQKNSCHDSSHVTKEHDFSQENSGESETQIRSLMEGSSKYELQRQENTGVDEELRVVMESKTRDEKCLNDGFQNHSVERDDDSHPQVNGWGSEEEEKKSSHQDLGHDEPSQECNIFSTSEEEPIKEDEKLDEKMGHIEGSFKKNHRMFTMSVRQKTEDGKEQINSGEKSGFFPFYDTIGLRSNTAPVQYNHVFFDGATYKEREAQTSLPNIQEKGDTSKKSLECRPKTGEERVRVKEGSFEKKGRIDSGKDVLKSNKVTAFKFEKNEGGKSLGGGGSRSSELLIAEEKEEKKGNKEECRMNCGTSSVGLKGGMNEKESTNNKRSHNYGDDCETKEEEEEENRRQKQLSAHVATNFAHCFSDTDDFLDDFNARTSAIWEEVKQKSARWKGNREDGGGVDTAMFESYSISEHEMMCPSGCSEGSQRSVSPEYEELGGTQVFGGRGGDERNKPCHEKVHEARGIKLDSGDGCSVDINAEEGIGGYSAEKSSEMYLHDGVKEKKKKKKGEKRGKKEERHSIDYEVFYDERAGDGGGGYFEQAKDFERMDGLDEMGDGSKKNEVTVKGKEKKRVRNHGEERGDKDSVKDVHKVKRRSSLSQTLARVNSKHRKSERGGKEPEAKKKLEGEVEGDYNLGWDGEDEEVMQVKKKKGGSSSHNNPTGGGSLKLPKELRSKSESTGLSTTKSLKWWKRGGGHGGGGSTDDYSRQEPIGNGGEVEVRMTGVKLAGRRLSEASYRESGQIESGGLGRGEWEKRALDYGAEEGGLKEGSKKKKSGANAGSSTGSSGGGGKRRWWKMKHTSSV